MYMNIPQISPLILQLPTNSSSIKSFFATTLLQRFKLCLCSCSSIMKRKRKMEDDDKFSSDDDFFKTDDDDDETSVNDPSSKTDNESSIDWCKFVHKVEDAKENLLKLKGETKLKVLRPFIKNSDLDLYKITVFELHKANNNALPDDDHTHTVCSISGSLGIEGSKNGIVVATACSVNNDGQRLLTDAFTPDKEKGKRSEINFNTDKSLVSNPATCSQKSEKVGWLKQPGADRDDDDGDDEERVVVVPDQQPPELPETLKQLHKDREVSEAVLVIQKKIYSTDVTASQGRLSMPLRQIKNMEFLSEEEKDLLSERGGIAVKLIDLADENCVVYNVTLKQWKLKNTSNYCLVTGWNTFATKNRLEVGMMVQVWAFRVDSELWFSLVKI